MLANVITTTLGKLRFQGHLRQEIDYNDVERVERTVAKGRERKGQMLQKGQRKGYSQRSVNHYGLGLAMNLHCWGGCFWWSRCNHWTPDPHLNPGPV